jgi:hypothetical protein
VIGAAYHYCHSVVWKAVKAVSRRQRLLSARRASGNFEAHLMCNKNVLDRVIALLQELADKHDYDALTRLLGAEQ